MHYKEYKTILSFNNTMNLYGGCSQGCIYCDSMDGSFNAKPGPKDIEVKQNSALILEEELMRRRGKVVIQMGGSCDPYLPLEKSLGNTRAALELIDKYEFGISIVTKSDLVLRDIDLLKSINEKAKAVVNISISTLNDGLARILEPGASTPTRRLEVLSLLSENNIPTLVRFSPVLPFLEDTEENVRNIVKQCSRCKVHGILNHGMGLTLKESNRDYFYKNLENYFPEIKEKYIEFYGNSYKLISPNNNQLREIFFEECNKEGIESDIIILDEFLKTIKEKEYEQLSLF